MIAIIFYSFITAYIIYEMLCITDISNNIIFIITALLLSLYMWIYSIAKVIAETITHAKVEVNIQMTNEMIKKLAAECVEEEKAKNE